MARVTVSIQKNKSKNYLSQKDIELIQNTIIEIFGDQTEQEITLNIERLKQELNYIIQKVQLIKIESSSSNKYRIKRTSQEKRRLMAEAYLIIFKVREYLLNESIDYRYYYTTSETANVIGFEEDNILNYIKFGREGIKIADNILKQQEVNQEYQALIDSHYNNLIQGIQSAKGSPFKVVHSYIMNKYESLNPGLRKQNGQYQVFTMGHILEAMDIAFSEAIEQDSLNNYDLIERYMYGKYLNYDSVAGTKGGDNPITMTQIKANVADLMDYSTLLKDLEKLKNIFSFSKIDRAKIEKEIRDLYIEADKYKDINDCNNMVDIAIDKVLNQIG